MALSEEDLQNIRNLIGLEIDERVPPIVQDMIQNAGLPTKEEFFKRMDELATILQTMQQEMSMSGQRVRDHEDRIEELEKIHPGGQHQTT